MPDPAFAAWLFSALIALAVFFQLALALGAPWGEWAMGGRFPGRFPPRMRWAALIQALLLVCMALIVLTRAGVVLQDYARFARAAIWAVVLFCLAAAILNTITPSRRERRLWAPVSIALFVCAATVALSERD